MKVRVSAKKTQGQKNLAISNFPGQFSLQMSTFFDRICIQFFSCMAGGDTDSPFLFIRIRHKKIPIRIRIAGFFTACLSISPIGPILLKVFISPRSPMHTMASDVTGYFLITFVFIFFKAFGNRKYK